MRDPRAMLAAWRGRRDAARVRGEAERAVAHAPRHTLWPLLGQLAAGARTQLDVGTGLMHSLEQSPVPVRVGLDAHRPYLENRRVADAVPVHGSAVELSRLFIDDAVDLVTLIDVIEHFAPADAASVLDQAEAVASRRVVLFTPRGQFEQDEHDAFGYGGEEFQRHRSAWEPEDFTARGYRVVVMDGYHGPWNKSFVESFGPDADPVDALVAWKDLGA